MITSKYRRSTYNKIMLLLISISISDLFFNNVFACDCELPRTPLDGLAKATTVFSGKVLEVKRALLTDKELEVMEVTFQVQTVWKGTMHPLQTIVTAASEATCGFNFEKDHEYLVYTFTSGGQLNTSLCNRTTALSSASEDLQELGEGRPPISENPVKFKTMALQDRVFIEWEIQPDPNRLGFYLWRALPQGKECTQDVAKYTDIIMLSDPTGKLLLFESKDTPILGTKYFYVDYDVILEKSYCYMLQEIDYKYNSTYYLDSISLVTIKNNSCSIK